jgi:hypothetical protein
MLFTCTLVRSHTDSKEGVRCETRFVEINSKILGWTGQQDVCSEREARRRLSLSLEWGHEGRIGEVLQEDGCSCMYKSWLCVLTCIMSVCSLSMPYNHLRPGNWLTSLIAVYFSQVKNKPWLHEFILASGTFRNSYNSKLHEITLFSKIEGLQAKVLKLYLMKGFHLIKVIIAIFLYKK